MADLPEDDGWVEGVRALEETDPVRFDIFNDSLSALASRTKYLQENFDGNSLRDDLADFSKGAGLIAYGGTTVKSALGELEGDLQEIGASLGTLSGTVDSFSPVATTGSYNDLIDTPTLGSAAAQDVSAFDPAGSAAQSLIDANAYTDTAFGDLSDELTLALDGRMSSAARDAVDALDPATATLEDLITALQLT